MAKNGSSFKPGHARIGGRKKGSVNKASKLVQEILESKGFNVVDRLIEIMDRPQSELKDKDKAFILLDLMQYIYPKRKAIEVDHTNENKEATVIRIGFEGDDGHFVSKGNSTPEKN